MNETQDPNRRHEGGPPPFPIHAALRAVLENSDDALFSKSVGGTITLWSRGAERMYGYRAEEILDQPVTRLMPPERQWEAEEINRRISGGETLDHYETVRMTKDGRRIEVSLTASPLRADDGALVGAFIIARDISPRRHLEAMERREERRDLVLDTANRVALDILGHRTGIEALRHIADAARQISGARYAALGVARQTGGLLEFVTVGLSPEEERVIGPRPAGRGILGLLLERTEPLRISRLSEDARSVGFPPNHPPMENFLGVPIRRGGVTLGSLYLTEKPGGFTDDDEAAVQALTAYAAIAIHTMHLLVRQRALVSGLIAAQEEERRAVAYDLHDGLTQFVMASHAHFEASRRAQEAGKSDRATREMDQGMRYLKEAVLESRRLVNGLRTLALDDLGLAGALEQLVTEEKTRAGWSDAELIHNIPGERFDKSLETAAYRIAQEALTNARKHGGAERVRILILLETPDHGAPRLSLEIRDWGTGFDPDAVDRTAAHVGLQGMTERARLIGGELTILSAPREGTTVRAVFPIAEAAPTPEEYRD